MKPAPLKEFATLLSTQASDEAVINSVAVDTRLLKTGALFFALPGATTDGHAHLAEAAAKGASAAVVKADYSGPDYRLPLIRVPDVLSALQAIAKHYGSRSKARKIAVTGSLGKTTTKDFISHLLKQKYRVAAAPGNGNSQIGLPLTIINEANGDEDFLVLEMGMTGFGHISKLVSIVPPEIAVVTTVALVHACYFDSIEEIAQAKSEIFSHPGTRVGIYPMECDFNQILSDSGLCKKQSFSTQVSGANYFLNGHGGEFNVWEDGEMAATIASLPVPGTHNRHNFLAAVAAVRNCGLSWEEICEGSKSLALPEKRLQFIEKNGVTFINDAYNASEMSMKAAFEVLPLPKNGGRRIAVLGEMVELGKFSLQCHRNVGKSALDHFDMVLCFGDGCRAIESVWKEAGRSVIWAKERGDIVAALREQLCPGDVVLLKGSRSKAVCKVLEEL